MKGLVNIAVGFAANPAGAGAAYARLGALEAGRVMRVSFRVTRYPALLEREVAYAALSAVSSALRDRGVERVRLFVEDARLAEDLREHREVPGPLMLAYVRLRCLLNQFASYEVLGTSESDLTARARSEIALHVAA